MSFSELFTAMEIKAIDGQENPLQTILTNKFYEIQKYATLTGHVYSPVTILASNKFMSSLTPDDQGGEACSCRSSQIPARFDGSSGFAGGSQAEGEGMVIDRTPAEELAKLQQLVKPVSEKFTPVIGTEFVREFTAEIDKFRKQK